VPANATRAKESVSIRAPLGVAAAFLAASATLLVVSSAGADASAPGASPRLAADSTNLGGWRPIEAGRSANISFDKGRQKGSRSLKLVDYGGSGYAALTTPVPDRASVTVQAAINVYRMKVDEGALRPLAWVGGGGHSQQAGIIRRGGELRWAAWQEAANGRRVTLSVSKAMVRTRVWQKITVRTFWTAKQSRTSIYVDGRPVIFTHPVNLRGIRADRVSIGLGRASKRRQSALVLLKNAGVSFRVGAIKPGKGAVAPPPPIRQLAAEAHPYSPRFAFNEAIPDGAASDPRSAAIVSQFASNASNGKVMLSTQGEVPPVYVAAPTDPLVTVNAGGVSTRFRMPKEAVAGSGSDHPLVILDPSHPEFGRNTELRLWQASVGANSLSASNGGLFHYNNDGSVLNPDGSESVAVPFRGSGTGSGLSIMAGLMRGEEVSAGEIRHALRFAYSAGDFTNRYRAPAVKSDQPKGTSTRNAAGAMDMGMRLQLDPSVDCEARTVPGRTAGDPETRFLRMVCRALQRYGMIAVDGTGTGGILFMGENEATANWDAIIGSPYNGSYGWILRDETTPSDGLSRNGTSGIPWNRLRVLASSEF
jgi:hypothetical protein